jgi:PAS domain S-box-containing protein
VRAGFVILGNRPIVDNDMTRIFATRDWRLPVAAFALAALAMTAFEALKEFAFPSGISLWQSHAITILMTSIIATVIVLRITRLQERRQAAETRAALFQNALLDAVPVAIFFKDRQGRYLGCNAIYTEITGASQADIRGKTVVDLWPGELAQTYHDKDIELIASPGVQQYEFKVKDRYGGTLDVIFRKSVFRDETGEVAGIIGAFFDITERKRAQQALQLMNSELDARIAERTAGLMKANRQLAANEFAMEKVGIGITWADFETGRFVYANQFAAGLLGYTVQELLKLGVSDIDPHFPAAAFQQIRETIRLEGHIQFETEQKTRDGLLLPVEMTIYYHEGILDDRPALIAFVADIRRRKAIEADLVMAKEEALAANAAKSEFLANMSHEIRTPLNAILGLNYLLRQEITNPMQSSKLDKIDVSGRHLLSLINDILDLSKIEAGKVVLENDNFHLSAVLDNVASIIRDSATDKGLLLDISHDHVPVWLWGDVTRLRQALLNFAANAIKFTNKGSVQIRALVVEDSGEHIKVRFEVSDTGIGLTPEQQHRLFQPFHQADGSISRKYGGTGLGLSLTHRLVELMNGTVGLRSVPGSGSTFWFEVPLERGHGPMPTAADAIRNGTAEMRLRNRFRGTRILYAEDNAINIEVGVELLHAVGMDVAIAENGRKALDLARGEVFALALMDMQMPEMGGVEATRAIRSLPGWSQVPILALTANAFADDRRACLDAGMNDVLVKPIEPAALYSSLLRWLSDHHAGDALSAPNPTRSETRTAEALDRVRTLGSVDVEQGQRLTGGDPARYLDLLRRSAASLLESVADCESLAKAGKHEATRNALHSIKGSSGTLGMPTLSAVAAHLEALFIEPAATPDPVAVSTGLCEMRAILAAVAQAVAPGSEADTSAATTTLGADFIEAKRQLIELLEQYDIAAVSHCQAKADVLQKVMGESFASFSRQISRFDFDAALETLRVVR